MFGRNKAKDEEESLNDAYENDDETIMRDSEMSNQHRISSETPEDAFQFEKFNLTPENYGNFPDLINKDLPLGKLDQDREYLKRLVLLVQSTRDIWVKEAEVPVMNENGEVAYKEVDGKHVVLTQKRIVFDTNFMPIYNRLLVDYGFNVVSSRALGKDREAILIRTAITNIKKQVTKDKDNMNKKLGLG